MWRWHWRGAMVPYTDSSSLSGGKGGKNGKGGGMGKTYDGNENGKHEAKGGGKKGGGKKGGGKNQKGAGGSKKFDGNCHHCGKYGHRKFECRTLDKEMADMKVKAGIGRGAPLAPGTLNEVGATDDGTWQWADDTAQELQDSAGAEWSLGIYAVRKDVPPSGIAVDCPGNDSKPPMASPALLSIAPETTASRLWPRRPCCRLPRKRQQAAYGLSGFAVDCPGRDSKNSRRPGGGWPP